MNEEAEKCIDLMFERLRKKVESGRYDKNTAILVYQTEYRPISLHHRLELTLRTEEYLAQQENVFVVYYCYTMSNTVDEVKS